MLNSFANLQPADVLYLQGDENYTFLHLANGQKIHSARTLKVFEKHFADQPFIRIHRAYLVNAQHVVSFSHEVCLSDGTRIQVSRRKESIVRRWLTNHFSKVSPIA